MRRVDRLLQGLQAVGDLDDVCAEHLHTRDVGSLLLDIDSAHIDIALESEIGGGCRQRDAVLTRAGLGDDLLLAHVLGEKRFAHAVVELVGAGMVQVLTLSVELDASAQSVGQALEVGDRGGSALELLADTAQLGDELAALADRIVCLRDLSHRGFELVVDIDAAVLAEIAVFVGIVIKISIKIYVIDFHIVFTCS